MAHRHNPEAERIIDNEYPVLDKGFVRLVDYLGDDSRIVEAARVSYAGGTKSYRQDRGLIRYLMRNEHTSPFEQVVFTFHLKMPIFVARQWVRHRTGRLNEISGRYSVMKEEYYLPAAEDIALQSPDNKQGRMDQPADPGFSDRVQTIFQSGREEIGTRYRELLDMGLARELARIDLPLSLYTEWYWQMDLHNLFRFLKLRLDKHAQREIRAYAEVILTIAETVCPIAAEAFRDFVLDSTTFSGPELEALRAMLEREDSGDHPGTPDKEAYGKVKLEGSERKEFFDKLGLEDLE